MKKQLTRKDFVVPGLLLALSAVPMLGGAMRLASLSAPATEESARFLAAPVPIVVHIVASALYALIGAFQFSQGFRRRWPVWHRRAGRVLAVAGLASAFTGVWMALLYPIPEQLQGPLTLVVRLVVGVAMFAGIVIAWRSAMRREIARHEAWMIRAYALGQGAGMQAVLMLPIILVTGEALGPMRDVLMTLAWVINVLAAEWIVRRRRAPRAVGAGLARSGGLLPGGGT